MKFRYSQKLPIAFTNLHNHHSHRHFVTSIFKKLQEQSLPRASFNGSKGSNFLLPGATVATILMFGALHVRRLYEDKKAEEARATFLRMLPLRSISRFWGPVTSVELPVWMRPYVHKAWARAFHSNLEEAAWPLDEYASIREFFVSALKEGSRPIDPDPHCLVSPVDGTILRFGELKGLGTMIEQVKGHSYSVSSLLGASSSLPTIADEDSSEERSEQQSKIGENSKKSWWKISLASPKVRDVVSARPTKGMYYCVIYLRPGDYHCIHSPVDWNILVCRHFAGHLFPVNERATRTIRNLYTENERVVLEGSWKQGFMAIAAIGATNIGSIELYIEPELRTNLPKKKLLSSEPPEERKYEPYAIGKVVKKGDEVAAFNMGSTVVLVFQAPTSKPLKTGNPSSEFRFNIRRGDRVRVGEALGGWHDL